MAGTIMIRKERDGLFHARPTFVCVGMNYAQRDKAVGIGYSPELAVMDLVPKLPNDVGMQLNAVDRWQYYACPEYIHIHDKCVDVDGHKPSRTEFRERRIKFLEQVALGRVESSWDLSTLLKN